MGLRPEAARAALAGLEAVRFVYRLPGDPVRFAAASPGVVDAAIARKLAELRQAQESLGQIASQYRALRLAEYGTGVFEVIRGAEALRERTLDLLTSARTEALNMVKPPVIAVHSEEHVRPGAAVRGRLIFDRDAVGDARTLDALRQSLDPHAEIRVHTNVPVKMLAIDRKLALIPLIQRDAVPLGVMIGESEVLDSILALFDYVWATAVRLHVGNVDSSSPAGKSPLPEADRQLLSLLLAGLTDEAIATRWRSPPDSRVPRWPTNVSRPSGSRSIRPLSRVIRRTSSSSSRGAPGPPRRRFSCRVPGRLDQHSRRNRPLQATPRARHRTA
jgi:sugar-specific transcriptional regulator TrmB